MTIRKQSRIRQGQADSERRIRELQDRGGAFVEAVEATRMPMLVTGPPGRRQSDHLCQSRLS